MKPTVFNYQEYEKVVEENKKLKAEVANLLIRCRIAESDKLDIVRCKDCKHRHEDECPMQFEEEIDIDEGDGYYDTEYIVHDYTQDDGFCSWGERREP